MRRNILTVVTSILFCLQFLCVCFAENPVVQTNYTPDPAPMVYNDTLFCYTSHDEDVLENNFFTMRDWCCFSTTDMVNWQSRGRIASLKDFSWAGTNGAWAVQCTHRDGKFYMYCPIHMKGIGVLVSDSPEGPFTDPLGKPLLNNGGNDIDPTVFIDDDDQAYLYWGNPTCTYAKLNQDMISLSGSRVALPMTVESFGARSNTDRQTSYEEGPWFYKRNGLYYLVFAGGPISEHIAYSTSSGPTGPWKYQGVVMSTQSGGAFTNHPGVVDYKGNSYLFYHNQALSRNGYKRSVCVEKFSYNSDGTIPRINSTNEGAPQVDALNPFGIVQAETICWESGVETNPCSEGGMMVDSINNGDYIKVKGVDFGTGAKSFEARVASGGSGGNIELRLGSQTGTLVGTCTVQNTGGWQTWVTASCKVSGVSGVKDLYLKFTGGSGFLFNCNWWQFTPSYAGIEDRGGNRDAKPFAVTVSIKYGTSRVLKLDFSPAVSQEKITVSLFDVSGRLVTTLFEGRVLTSPVTLPLNRSMIGSGTYLIKISRSKTNVICMTEFPVH